MGLTGHHFSPLWNLVLSMYTGTGRREELTCGRKGLQGGENKRRPWKDRRTLHAFFHVESGFTTCICGEGKGGRAMG